MLVEPSTATPLVGDETPLAEISTLLPVPLSGDDDNVNDASGGNRDGNAGELQDTQALKTRITFMIKEFSALVRSKNLVLMALERVH